MKRYLPIGFSLLLTVASSAPAQSPRADISWLAGGHLAPIASVSYSPNGSVLASSGYFGDTLKLWRASDGSMLRTFANTTGNPNQFIFGPMEPVTFLPDGNTVIALGEGSSIGVWRVTDGKLLRTIPVSGSDLALSHDGTLIAVSTGSFIRLVRFSDGVVLRSIAWPGNSLQRVAFSLDDATVAGGDNAGMLRTFRVSDGAPRLSIPAHPNSIEALSYSPNGTRIATGSADRTIKLWDSTTGDLAGTLTGHTDGVTSLGFSVNGALIASGSADNTARIWTLPSGALLATLTQPSGVSSVSLNPAANRIVVASNRDLQEWDIPSQSLIRSLTRASQQISGIDFTPDSTKVVSCSYDGKVSVHDVATGTLLRQMTPGGNAFAVATSADTVAAAINVPNTIKLFRLSDGAPLRTLVPSGSMPYTYSAAFAPGGAILATGHLNNSVQLWDVSSGTLINTLPGQSGAINGVAFSSDGSILVAASSGGYVHVWNAAGNPIRTLGPVGQALSTVAISPDNQFVLAGGQNGLLELWRLDSGAFVYSFSVSGGISQVRFSSSGFAFYAGNTIGSLNATSTLRVYRTSDHTLLEAYNLEISGFGNNPSGPLALGVSPDGKRFSYGRDDATVVMAYNTLIAAPTSAVLVMGQSISGSVQDLVIADGNALVARAGQTGDRQSAPLQLDLTAHSSLPNPTSLSFQIVASANISGLEQEIWMRNVQNGTLELVDSRPAPTGDQTLRIVLGPNIARYIDGAGNIMARVKWFSPLQTGSRSWQISVDQAVWAVGL